MPLQGEGLILAAGGLFPSRFSNHRFCAFPTYMMKDLKVEATFFFYCFYFSRSSAEAGLVR